MKPTDMMSFKVFGFRRFPQNPRRCSRGFPRSPRRRRRRHVILEKAIALSFPVRPGGRTGLDQPNQGFSPNRERTRQLHLLPRDDSNSRYRLCFARLARTSPSPGPSRMNGLNGRGSDPSTLWRVPKLNMRTSSVIHTTPAYAKRITDATTKFTLSELILVRRGVPVLWHASPEVARPGRTYDFDNARSEEGEPLPD